MLVATGEPNVLYMKCAQVVTSPKVDKALGLWVQDMEQKRRTMMGLMLIEQRKQFEEALDIPEEQWLTGMGWIDSFKKGCTIKTLIDMELISNLPQS